MTPEINDYAKKQAVGFLIWYANKMIGFLDYIRTVKPLVSSNEIEEKLAQFEGKPVEELYEQYVAQLKPNTDQ